MQVDEAAGRRFRCTRGIFRTGSRRHAVLAVERLGEDARERGLADAARTGKQVGMVQALLAQRVRERAHDVLLADQLRQNCGGRHLRARTCVTYINDHG